MRLRLGRLFLHQPLDQSCSMTYRLGGAGCTGQTGAIPKAQRVLSREEKIIPSFDPTDPEKAHINIDTGASPLYKEIRIASILTDEDGEKVKLKKGAKVEVTIEANPSGVIPKP